MLKYARHPSPTLAEFLVLRYLFSKKQFSFHGISSSSAKFMSWNCSGSLWTILSQPACLLYSARAGCALSPGQHEESESLLHHAPTHRTANFLSLVYVFVSEPAFCVPVPDIYTLIYTIIIDLMERSRTLPSELSLNLEFSFFFSAGNL